MFRNLPLSEQFIQVLFSRIQAYSEPCVSLPMQTPSIFGILEYSESLSKCIPTHTQNPVIFTKIGKLWVTLEILNPGILTVLGFSEL